MSSGLRPQLCKKQRRTAVNDQAPRSFVLLANTSTTTSRKHVEAESVFQPRFTWRAVIVDQGVF